MAHLTDGTLRRMFDDPDARVGGDAAHLEGCADCKARFEVIARDARSIATLLAVPDAAVDVRSAFAKVSEAPRFQPGLVRLPVFGSPVRPMRFALVAAAMVALLAVVAFAAEGLFYKPSTVTPVPVTVADMQALSQLADYGTIAWTQQPQFQAATSPTDAAAIAGLTAPTAGSVPATISKTITYGAMTKAIATFTFNASKAQSTAAAKGKTLPAMPAGMDGATLTVTVGPAVGEIYGDLKQPESSSANNINLPQLVIAKSAAPTVTSTQVSAATLENYILSLPGISPELRNAVLAVKDPTTTLLIPVPVQYATATQVTINGANGVALGDNTGLGGGVVWVGKDGYVYVVAGSIKKDDAVNIAKTL